MTRTHLIIAFTVCALLAGAPLACLAQNQPLPLPDVNTLTRRLNDRLSRTTTLRSAILRPPILQKVEDAAVLNLRGTLQFESQREALRQAAERTLTELGVADAAVKTDEFLIVPPPVTVLIPNVRRQMSFDVRFGGVNVTVGSYDADGKLVLEGRIPSEEMRDEVRGYFNDVYLPQHYGAGASLNVVAENLQVVVPSVTFASEFFNAGFLAYRRCDFFAARDAMELAVLEAPARRDYLYFLIATEIAVGDEETALGRLVSLAELRRQQPFEMTPIYERLETVQGPVRQRLLELEYQALAMNARGTKTPPGTLIVPTEPAPPATPATPATPPAPGTPPIPPVPPTPPTPGTR